MMVHWFQNGLSRLLSRVLSGALSDRRFFDRYQSRGVHVLRTGFYSPVPDTREIDVVDGKHITKLRGIAKNIDVQRERLESPEFQDHFAECQDMIARYRSEGRIPVTFARMDASMAYHFVRSLRPKKIIEIGCGFSTIVMSEALEASGVAPEDCDFTSIDPFPREYLLQGASRAKMLPEKVQNVPLETFEALGDGDILFIDSSHVLKAGSDVLYEINEILPSLAPGVHIHVHDIHFPYDYKREWIMEKTVFWNEQYALQAFLQFNSEFEILWSVSMMRSEHPELMTNYIPDFDQNVQQGGSLWMRRVLR